MTHANYVLITPVRNGAAHIEQTLHSVVSQTCPPQCWVIVNDGSTDRTEEIVRDYVNRYPFIRLVERVGDPQRNFGSKVRAFQAGYESLGPAPYEFIGNLDGDLSFDADYFAQLLARLARDPGLGLVGGFILEQVNNRFVPRKVSLQSVAGAVQFFRRPCFEQVGGIRVHERGGEDSVAEISARLRGWRVRTFPELPVRHHGPILSGGKTIWQSRFNKGFVNYQLGYHPLFNALLGLRRIFDRPLLIGGLMILAGYGWAALKRDPRNVPPEFVAFLRREQLGRIRQALPGRLHISESMIK